MSAVLDTGEKFSTYRLIESLEDPVTSSLGLVNHHAHVSHLKHTAETLYSSNWIEVELNWNKIYM